MCFSAGLQESGERDNKCLEPFLPFATNVWQGLPERAFHVLRKDLEIFQEVLENSMEFWNSMSLTLFKIKSKIF